MSTFYMVVYHRGQTLYPFGACKKLGGQWQFFVPPWCFCLKGHSIRRRVVLQLIEAHWDATLDSLVALQPWQPHPLQHLSLNSNDTVMCLQHSHWLCQHSNRENGKLAEVTRLSFLSYLWPHPPQEKESGPQDYPPPPSHTHATTPTSAICGECQYLKYQPGL